MNSDQDAIYALEQAVRLARPDETEAQTVERAKAFYDFIQGATRPSE